MSVAYVTLDNPPANSYDLSVMQAFAADVDEAIASDARVVVVRSASEKFFSAGADIKAFNANSVEDNMRMIRQAHEGLSEMARTPKVFIAQYRRASSSSCRAAPSTPPSARSGRCHRSPSRIGACAKGCCSA